MNRTLRRRGSLGLLPVLALLLVLAPSIPPGHDGRDPAEGLFGGRRVLAEDEAPSFTEEERQEAVERHTERGWRAFRSGNHDEVLSRMDRLARYAPDDPLPDYLRVRIGLRRGDYESALERATKALERHPGHKGLQAARYDLWMRLGRQEDLVSRAREAVAEDPLDAMAHSALGSALEERGLREEALDAHRAAIRSWSLQAPAEYLPWVAQSAIRATWLSESPADDLLGDAGKLLGRHLERHPDDQDVLLMVADLFQADRGPKGQAKASKYYRQILEENPEIAEARVGLARTLLVFWQQDRAMAELERALQTNARLVPALSLLASIHVGNGDYDRAEEILDRAAKVNAHDRQARAVRAGLLWITGEHAAYAALEQQARAWNPTDGRFYVTISDLVGERQRRYDVAAEFARKAVETDGNDALGYVTLGEALMNLGQTDEARQAFETSIEKSKGYKDVKRDNWLEVLRVLDGFREVDTQRFAIRLHPSEVDVMKRYLPPLMETAWDTLSAKYGYTPQGPVRVDAFNRADDFSVRSIGVSGLPALGVCFGEVITLLGPTSRPVGSFSWARTAWHEFAHTITLGLSRGQVPRWLTEGLSVYEEKARRSNWSREMERELFDRYHNDRLLRMGSINRAFRGPDIGFAYYQGGLIAEHLTQTRGFEVIPKMLEAFGEDRSTAQVFGDVLGIELDAYDEQFRDYVKGIVGEYKMVPRWDDKSLAAFEARTRSNPDDAEAWVRLGWAHLQRGRSIDAGGALAKARALAPERDDVVLLEGRLAEANGRADLATAAYERFLAAGGDDLQVRLFLAQAILGRGGDSEAAVRHLEAAKACFPFAVGRGSPYLQLAQMYRGAGQVEKAIAELEAYAQVAGESYDVRKELLAWYREKKDHEAVVRLAAEMVDITPFGANPGQPPDLELHRAYADALLALDRRDEGIRELEVQVLLMGTLEEDARREAGAVADHLLLARLYLAADRPLDALEQAVAALRLSPQDPDARMLRARAEEAAGYR